jgi:hypothetical protein
MLDINRLKQEFEDRPIEVLAVASAAAIAVSKVIEAVSGARSKNAYARRMNHAVRRR